MRSYLFIFFNHTDAPVLDLACYCGLCESLVETSKITQLICILSWYGSLSLYLLAEPPFQPFHWS